MESYLDILLNGVKVTERDYWYETDNISCVIRELDIIAQTYRAKLIYDWQLKLFNGVVDVYRIAYWIVNIKFFYWAS